MNSTRSIIVRTLSIVLTALSCSLVCAQSPAAYRYTPPETLNDGIRTGTLKDAGLDEAKIVAGTNEILNGTYPNIHSLLIFRNGRLVYENYFTGEDVERGVGPIGVVTHTRDTLHDMRSVTKSVVALAVLIAHSQGKIKSLDQPVFQFFPEYSQYAEGSKKDITVKHLLAMSAGLEWNERMSYADPANSEIQMDRAPNPVEYVLTQRAVEKPGTVFNYSGGLSQVLAEIVKRTTGSTIDVFTEKHLFAPLGITRYKWVYIRNGFPSAASGLRLRSRDMAKIGLLVMNNGKWNGKRILPEKLVTDAVAEHIKFEQPGEGGGPWAYGYQIWRPSILIDNTRFSITEFTGNGGQTVQIDERTGIMIAVTAGNYNKRGLKRSSYTMYEDFVYAALHARTRAKPNEKTKPE